MCGRFVSTSPPDELARYFDVDQVAEQVLETSYNVAPTNDVYVVFESGGARRLDAFHWGLVPHWAKDPGVGNRMINARAETLTTKNAFKQALRRRRCIIPADGFYEWKKIPGQRTKQPMYISRNDGEPLAFAGLWEVWRDKSKPESESDQDSEILRSCTIITGEPNKAVAEVHDRMPVMLPPSAWDAWLNAENDDVETLGKLLVPAPASILTLHPVSTAVNNVREKGAGLIKPLESTE